MRTSRKYLKEPSGFTLLELMIAMVILAFGLMGVSGMILTAVKGNAFGSRMMQATSMAQDKIEEMHNMTYIDLYSTCATGFPDPCPFAPANMALDPNKTVMEAANDGGTDGDDLTGGAGDGIWTYKHNDTSNPLPAGMTLAWGVRRNYPQPRLIWLVAVAEWEERGKTHTVRVESIRGNFN